jgi:hypothetical protein
MLTSAMGRLRTVRNQLLRVGSERYVPASAGLEMKPIAKFRFRASSTAQPIFGFASDL